MKAVRIVFIPGNMGGDARRSHWFPYVKTTLEAKGYEVIAARFPDSFLARKSKWIPFLESLGVDENTVLVGHSSGAIAAMRYAETHHILGSVLVAAYHTHFWNPLEVLSGYFGRIWDWDAIRANQKFIIQFTSTDDSVVPPSEGRYVHEKLQSDYTEFTDRKHFGQKEFPELVEKLTSALKQFESTKTA